MLDRAASADIHTFDPEQTPVAFAGATGEGVAMPVISHRLGVDRRASDLSGHLNDVFGIVEA